MKDIEQLLQSRRNEIAAFIESAMAEREKLDMRKSEVNTNLEQAQRDADRIDRCLDILRDERTALKAQIDLSGIENMAATAAPSTVYRPSNS